MFQHWCVWRSTRDQEFAKFYIDFGESEPPKPPYVIGWECFGCGQKMALSEIFKANGNTSNIYNTGKGLAYAHSQGCVNAVATTATPALNGDWIEGSVEDWILLKQELSLTTEEIEMASNTFANILKDTHE